MQTLVIIDMQPGFRASEHKHTQRAIIESVFEARLAKTPIIIVEYNTKYRGHTLDCILEAIGEYEQVHFVSKEQTDGGDEVEEVLKEQGLKGSQILVCGIELACCVEATITTLVRKFREKVTLLKRACYCSRLIKGDWLNKEDIIDDCEIFYHPNVTIRE